MFISCSMFHVPDYKQNLSLRLSEVLDDIGVNEEMVLKRRKAVLLEETMKTITRMPIHRVSIYNFGSLSEGTTTEGLHSDSDSLNCVHKCNVIQDIAEWEPGFRNLLMIQDNTTTPGYCLLQRIHDDVPLLGTYVPDKYHVRDASGRVLLKNTMIRDRTPAGAVQHGPSWAIHGAHFVPGSIDYDVVPAYHCRSWPYEARPWLHRQGIARWPTADMKRFAVNNGCFIVSVGSKVSQNPELEWRISTSQAERCLV
ncbi:uncharacterized protein LOC128552117 [Mercenaria mercenaria]|uniref:uncharacterized protein LOC128552117 n=1 Tax=Mercenaria mercenaria TaxID=6596 RepID=UPI00234F0261|nr:uncharacterized protein LOC128552117 [Mercenaria mercenaria]